MSMQEENIRKIANTLKGVKLTEKEHGAIKWLCNCEPETVSNIAAVIDKAAKHAVYIERTRSRELNKRMIKTKSKVLGMEL